MAREHYMMKLTTKESSEVYVMLDHVVSFSYDKKEELTTINLVSGVSLKVTEVPENIMSRGERNGTIQNTK